MTRKQELTSRWDDFLTRIRARFDESLAAAETAVLESLRENDYDYYASARMLTSIVSQVDDSLIRKIDLTWEQQVAPAMAADGHYWADELHKGHALTTQLQEKLRRFTFIMEGRLSQAYYQHCIHLADKDLYCTQCSAPLRIRPHFFRAQYVTCQYCNTVNTFEPATKYVHIGWNVVNNIAALHALEEYDAAQQAERSGNEAGHRAAYRRYLERYFRERARLMPDTAATFEADVAAEMNKRFGNC